ncbi:MAG: sigma-54 dependent transcriptional regulator [Sneathiella sp.]|uniref:sigma-54-dependent transcriptional regulator n=1 Tax=Sneathiella sp. TaxID=1964365 RepID=UPI0030017AD5
MKYGYAHELNQKAPSSSMTIDHRQHILLVEDDPPLARVYQEYLKNEPYQITHVARGEEAMNALKTTIPDAVLLDLKLPDMNGIEILKHIQNTKISTTVIVITAHGSINTAVEAMQAGAADFVLKPFNADRLVYTLRNALERDQLSRIVKTFKEDFNRQEFAGFIGSSLSMQAVYRIIDNAASSSATIFITGESGTGKEVCAEAIHDKSPRRNRRIVALNCGAIPKDLMESEIFGHVKGAFTGAQSNRDGAAKLADGGTLFLDEICEMDPTLQVKLLRFIQSGTFQKVGNSETETVDVRFICATNKDPWKEVQAGNFREDLYYRLHVIPLHMPPLRERENDVIEIAEHFLETYASEEGKDFNQLSEDVKNIFLSQGWPGNVRQLQNTLRNAVVLNEGDILDESMLPDMVSHNFIANPVTSTRDQSLSPQVTNHLKNPVDGDETSTIAPMWQVERQMIEIAMSEFEDNVHKVATVLEISPSTLYRRLREIEDDKKQKENQA